MRAQVPRTIDQPPMWSASINSTDHGKHASRETAMQLVEANIALKMRPTLADWIVFQVDPKTPTR